MSFVPERVVDDLPVRPVDLAQVDGDIDEGDGGAVAVPEGGADDLHGDVQLGGEARPRVARLWSGATFTPVSRRAVREWLFIIRRTRPQPLASSRRPS